MKFSWVFPVLLLGLVRSASFAAVEFKEAEITTIKNMVEHDPGSGATPAKVNEKILEKSKVSTAAASMAELTFADTSITRMGANTQFSFSSKERLVKLDQGTVLIHTPPGNGGATVDCGGVTGAVSGTTFMASHDVSGNVMFVLLEGEGGLKVTVGGNSTVIRPGQAASVGADSVKESPGVASSEKGPAAGPSASPGEEKGPGGSPTAGGGDSGGTPPPAAPKIQVFDIDVKRVVTTSPLVMDFKGELPSASKIEKTIETQQQAVKEGKLEKLEVEAVAVKSGDGDLLVGAPKVEKEEFVVVNKKLDVVGKSTGGDGLDIDTAAGPGAGGGGAGPAQPASGVTQTARAMPSTPPTSPNSSANISQTANQTPPSPSGPTSIQLAFANGNGTVTLNRPALQATPVTLSGFSGLPGSVTIPAGASSASFALPADPRNYFPGFLNPSDPSSGFRPLTATATAGSLSASANAVPGWFDLSVMRSANAARRTPAFSQMDADEVAALDAFFYFRAAADGGSLGFYDAFRSRSLNLANLTAPDAIRSLAGAGSFGKDYYFSGSLGATGIAGVIPLADPGAVFYANRIDLGLPLISPVNPPAWSPLVGSTTAWTVPDGSASGNSQTLPTPIFDNNLPLAARLNLKISPLPTDPYGAYLGDFAAYLRHTSADGQTRTVRLFERIGSTPSDPSGSPANGLEVTLSDWHAANINLQDTAGTLTGSLTGSYRPGYGGWPMALNDLVAINPAGDWTLWVGDLSTGAMGQVESWSLDVASMFHPQVVLRFDPPSGSGERAATFASGDAGTLVQSLRMDAQRAQVEFVSSGEVEMKQVQFENLDSRFTAEGAGKVIMGAGPAASQETADREQVRILADTATSSGVPEPGSLAVIRSGNSLELRNVTIRGFSESRLETVSGGSVAGRVLMSGSSVRDFKIKELVGAAVNADAKIQMAGLDADGNLGGTLTVEKQLPVKTELAKVLDASITGARGEIPVQGSSIDLAANQVRLNQATLTAMNSITARANTVLIQNSFMTVVQNSGMINMYVSTGLVNRTYGGPTLDGYLNFAGAASTFRIGNVLNLTIADSNGILNAISSGQMLENVSSPQAGKVNVLKL